MSIPGDDYIGEPGYPAPWTTRTPREGLRDTDQARIISLAPDVCRSPGKPVPYPVVDFCGHDENYTPSVRFTGQKAMVMRSNTSHVHGDAPGIGKGVVSNTVGGISEPIEHAAQVRAEGSPVIRHLDRFHMNNRNTVGEAIFVRDTRTFAAPKDDDPLPGSMVANDKSKAPPQPSPPDLASLQSAAIASPTTAGAMGGAVALSRGGAISGAGNGALLGELSAGARLALKRFGFLGAAYTTYELGQRENQRAWNAPADYMEQEALRYGGIDSFDTQEMQIYDRAVERLQAGAAQGHVRGDFYQQMDAYRARRNTEQAMGDSVRVSAASETTTWPCLVGPYREIRKVCPGEAHHIVPDMALRYGTRAAGMQGLGRIPNAPSFQDGMTVCLNPAMHYGVHGALTTVLHAAGTAGPVNGTAPMARITELSAMSINAIPGLDPACKARAQQAAREQMFPIRAQPGRTTITLPKPDATMVLSRGSY